MNFIFDFIKKHYKVFLAMGLVIVAYLGGLYQGRGDKEIQIVETQKVVIQEVLKIVEVEKVVVNRGRDLNENKTIHKERTEEPRPDGTILVKETTDIGIDRTVKEVEVKYVDRYNITEKVVEVEKIVQVEKIIKPKAADWAVTARLGTSFTEFKPQLTVPYIDPLIVGIGVDRRILGPFKAGLWVNSTTKLDSVVGGISLGVEF